MDYKVILTAEVDMRVVYATMTPKRRRTTYKTIRRDCAKRNRDK